MRSITYRLKYQVLILTDSNIYSGKLRSLLSEDFGNNRSFIELDEASVIWRDYYVSFFEYVGSINY
ncbi:MAG: hypothetical protein V7K35_20020 [Nostoc sp.]